MSDFIPGATDSATMPFTKFVNDSEAAHAREHPEDKAPPLSETEIGKVILEQESRVAQDHAAGRISDEEYNAFRDLSESRTESLRSHLQEVGKDLGEGIDSWKHDAVSTWEDFKAAHPDALADLNSGNPSIVHVAETTDMVVKVVDPLVDPLVDGTHHVLDAVRDELGETAQQMVDARAEQKGADPNEIEASRVKVEVARDHMSVEIDKAHGAIDAFRDKAHDDADAILNAVHGYAESHPDSHLNDVNPGAITDPHIHEAIQAETQVTEV